MCPVYLLINELPVEARFKNIIVIGLWYGRNKPGISILLSSIVDLLNDLNKNGIETTIKGELRKIKLYTCMCSVNSMAWSPIQVCKQCNGRFECSWCLHEGSYDKPSRSKKYLILDYISPLRNEKETKNIMEQAKQDDYVET